MKDNNSVQADIKHLSIREVLLNHNVVSQNKWVGPVNELIDIIEEYANQFKPQQTAESVEETIEQAAVKAGKVYYSKPKPANTYTFHEGFKSGANRQNANLVKVIKDRIVELGKINLTEMDDLVSKATIYELKNLLKLIEK